MVNYACSHKVNIFAAIVKYCVYQQCITALIFIHFYLDICLFACLFLCLFVCLSVCLLFVSAGSHSTSRCIKAGLHSAPETTPNCGITADQKVRKWFQLRGTAPMIWIKMVCMLFQSYQHIFVKNNTCILSKLSKELKNDIEILVNQVVLSNGSKQSKLCFDQYKSRIVWST